MPYGQPASGSVFPGGYGAPGDEIGKGLVAQPFYANHLFNANDIATSPTAWTSNGGIVVAAYTDDPASSPIGFERRTRLTGTSAADFLSQAENGVGFFSAAIYNGSI